MSSLPTVPQGDGFVPDRSRMENLQDRLAFNASMERALRSPGMVVPPSPQPFQTEPPAWALGGTSVPPSSPMRGSHLPAPQPPAPSSPIPAGFIGIDLLTWEVVADNGSRFPILHQDEARSVVQFCYNVMIRFLNAQSAQLRQSLGIPEPLSPAQVEAMRAQQAAMLQPAPKEEVQRVERVPSLSEVRRGETAGEVSQES